MNNFLNPWKPENEDIGRCSKCKGHQVPKRPFSIQLFSVYFMDSPFFITSSNVTTVNQTEKKTKMTPKATPRPFS